MSSFLCRSKKRAIFAVLCTLVAVLFYIFKSTSINETFLLNENCKIAYSASFLSKLCTNYSLDRAHGNLCSQICKRNNFETKACIKHSSTIVIDGKLNKTRIVIKWKKPNWPDRNSVEQLKAVLSQGSTKHYGQQLLWKDLVLDRLSNAIGDAVNKIPSNEKEKILQNLKAPSKLGYRILASFLSLVENEEYAMLGTFQELKHFPKLYGYCGQAYVMERLIPYNHIFPAFVHKLDWKKRAKLALSFLDMVVELESAKGGPLQHCDIQEGNFGITNDYEIKLIDVDLILTKEKAEMFLPQPNCSKDADCDFFDCVSKCHVKKGKCLAKRITSNIQVLCRDIFKSSWPSTGLFGKMPSTIQHLIAPLLNECSSARFGYLPFNHKKVRTLIKNFKYLLSRSLKKS